MSDAQPRWLRSGAQGRLPPVRTVEAFRRITAEEGDDLLSGAGLIKALQKLQSHQEAGLRKVCCHQQLPPLGAVRLDRPP